MEEGKTMGVWCVSIRSVHAFALHHYCIKYSKIYAVPAIIFLLKKIGIYFLLLLCERKIFQFQEWEYFLLFVLRK
jgi:hypothetical protein